MRIFLKIEREKSESVKNCLEQIYSEFFTMSTEFDKNISLDKTELLQVGIFSAVNLFASETLLPK